MSHKLQVSPSENNGCDSVVRNDNSTSEPEIPSNYAGPAQAVAANSARDGVSEQDSLSIASTAEAHVACTSSNEEPDRGDRNHLGKFGALRSCTVEWLRSHRRAFG